MSFNERKYRKTIEELENALIQFDKTIILYSGGKDSTLVTHLITEIVEKCRGIDTEIIVAMSDTRVEMPWLWENSINFLRRIDQWSRDYGYNIKTITVKPKSNKTFWTTLIGKGYPMPHYRFRWCVRLLKLLPMKEYLKKNTPSLILMGMRWDESLERKRNMKKRGILGKWTKYDGIKDATVYLPIADWTANDVINTLSHSKTPWGTNYSSLLKIYSKAGVCYKLKDGTFKCNGSRFGCWTCSVVQKDKTLQNLAKNNCKLAENMLEFKKYLIKTTQNKRNRIKKSNNCYGAVKKSVRKVMFEKLLSFCSNAEKYMFNDYEIVSDDEIEIIHEMLY